MCAPQVLVTMLVLVGISVVFVYWIGRMRKENDELGVFLVSVVNAVVIMTSNSLVSGMSAALTK